MNALRRYRQQALPVDATAVRLRRWQLGNFKSVRSADVELKALTLLVGANSAGKSSLIQSILAANQAIRTLGDLYPLNGGTVRLGTVEEVRHRGPEARPEDRMVFGAEFDVNPRRLFGRGMRGRAVRRPGLSKELANVTWRMELGSAPAQQSGRAQIERVEMTFRANGKADPESAHIDSGAFENHLRVDARHEADGTEMTVFDPTAQRAPLDFEGVFGPTAERAMRIVDVAMRGGLPHSGFILRSRAEFLLNLWVLATQNQAGFDDEDTPRSEADSDALMSQAVQDLLTADASHPTADKEYERIVRSELNDIFAAREDVGVDWNVVYSATFRDNLIRELSQRGIVGDVPVQHHLDEVGAAANILGEFLSENIRYLGPLREDPRVVYQDSPESGNGYVGSKGEYCAAVLQRSGAIGVRVPMPDGRVRPTTLSGAVDAWAQYLDIGQSFAASDQGRFGLQMQVKQSDVDIQLDLTSVGTGVSQLLPVLVMCLQAPVGTLLMMEQPELHLNPRVQQRLADFLLAIARSGRQLIVETHSEYLISRLRLRVAEDDTDSVRQAVGILFAERRDGSTTYRAVGADPYGALENWPENFFDQSAEETHAILSAAVAKQRRTKARGGH